MQTWQIVLEAAPWFIAGFFVAGLIHAWVPVSKIARHLGQRSFGGVIKAAIAGAPLPLCSCSVIPVASSMRRSGASRGAVAGFLISTPETGVDSISITYALLGPLMAVLRPLAAVITAVTAGVFINWFDPDKRSTAAAETDADCDCDCSCGSCCDSTEAMAEANGPTEAGLAGRMVVAMRYGFVEMFADLGVWLVVGFVLAGLISAALPAEFFARYLGSGLVGMVLVLVVALPLYVCASESTPVAAALIAKGMSPGTALVFLLAGPATNAATMAIVGKELGRRCLAVYLVSIAVVSVLLGLLLDWMLVFPALSSLQVGHVQEAVSNWQVAAGVVLVLLMLNGLWVRYGAGWLTTAAKQR